MLIITAFLSAMVVYLLLFVADPVTTRYMEFSNCRVKYNYHRNTYSHTGNLDINYRSIQSARQKLIFCLCDEYMSDQDSIVKEYILSYFQSHYECRYKYFKNVMRSKPDSLLVMNNCVDIFQSDAKILKSIESNKDGDLEKLYGYLSNELRFNNGARDKYFRLHDSIFPVEVSIDSIIVNRYSIF